MESRYEFQIINKCKESSLNLYQCRHIFLILFLPTWYSLHVSIGPKNNTRFIIEVGSLLESAQMSCSILDFKK